MFFSDISKSSNEETIKKELKKRCVYFDLNFLYVVFALISCCNCFLIITAFSNYHINLACRFYILFANLLAIVDQFSKLICLLNTLKLFVPNV